MKSSNQSTGAGMGLVILVALVLTSVLLFWMSPEHAYVQSPSRAKSEENPAPTPVQQLATPSNAPAPATPPSPPQSAPPQLSTSTISEDGLVTELNAIGDGIPEQIAKRLKDANSFKDVFVSNLKVDVIRQPNNVTTPYVGTIDVGIIHLDSKIHGQIRIHFELKKRSDGSRYWAMVDREVLTYEFDGISRTGNDSGQEFWVDIDLGLIQDWYVRNGIRSAKHK